MKRHLTETLSGLGLHLHFLGFIKNKIHVLIKSLNHIPHTFSHRHRSSVNFRGTRPFCLKNMYEKLTKFPNFYMILARKLAKHPNFYDIFTISGILHDFSRKIAQNFFPRILGGPCPPPPSPMPMHLDIRGITHYALYNLGFLLTYHVCNY